MTEKKGCEMKVVAAVVLRAAGKIPYLHENRGVVLVAAPEVWQAGDGHFDAQLDPYLHRQPLLLLGGDESAELPAVVLQVGAGELVQRGHAVQRPLLAQNKRCFLRVRVLLGRKAEQGAMAALPSLPQQP